MMKWDFINYRLSARPFFLFFFFGVRRGGDFLDNGGAGNGRGIRIARLDQDVALLAQVPQILAHGRFHFSI